MVSLKCKNCSAELKYLPKESKYRCDFCGSSFLVEKDISKSEDFTIVAGILIKYTGVSPLAIIPSEALVIGDECFKDIETIESIAIPETVTKIGKCAFENCKNLKEVSISESVKEIGDAAFKGCGLKSIQLSNSLEKIGKDAFMECSQLKHVRLPENKRLQYERTFKLCGLLDEVECNTNDFCLSFMPSAEASKNGDERSTLFDAFQATPFFNNALAKAKEHACILCGGSINDEKVCTNCGAKYLDFGYKEKEYLFNCYIATAVYGSYDCPQVWTLRRYRDNTLAQTWYGRAFIKTYYAISPKLVKWFGDKKSFKKFWKKRLDRMVLSLNEKGYENTPYKDKSYTK